MDQSSSHWKAMEGRLKTTGMRKYLYYERGKREMMRYTIINNIEPCHSITKMSETPKTFHLQKVTEEPSTHFFGSFCFYICKNLFFFNF